MSLGEIVNVQQFGALLPAERGSAAAMPGEVTSGDRDRGNRYAIASPPGFGGDGGPAARAVPDDPGRRTRPDMRRRLIRLGRLTSRRLIVRRQLARLGRLAVRRRVAVSGRMAGQVRRPATRCKERARRVPEEQDDPTQAGYPTQRPADRDDAGWAHHQALKQAQSAQAIHSQRPATMAANRIAPTTKPAL